MVHDYKADFFLKLFHLETYIVYHYSQGNVKEEDKQGYAKSYEDVIALQNSYPEYKTWIEEFININYAQLSPEEYITVRFTDPESKKAQDMTIPREEYEDLKEYMYSKREFTPESQRPASKEEIITMIGFRCCDPEECFPRSEKCILQ